MDASFHMIDVGAKPITHRMAIAQGEIHVGAPAFALIHDRQLPKGDVLILAEIAGITGAKKAYELIPLCHPRGLDQVRILTELDEKRHTVLVTCIASTHARTGIEMEALAGVSAALLTIWDLTKMVEPNLTMGQIRLLAKKGGKSGLWLHPGGLPDHLLALVAPVPQSILTDRTAAVVTLSDRAHQGVYADASGVLLRGTLETYGAEVVDYTIIPDDVAAIQDHILSLVADKSPDLSLCTGGTGVAPRDVTPEALTPLFDRTIPGVGELLRHDGAQYTPLSWSSRSTAGIIGQTLIVTLPGNPKAVREGLNALLPELLPHLIRTIQGVTV